MDYAEFMNRKVVAYFIKGIYAYSVEGILESVSDSSLSFREVYVTILNNNGEHEQMGFLGNLDNTDDFSKGKFKESDLIGICSAK